MSLTLSRLCERIKGNGEISSKIYMKGIAEIVLINPLIPLSWGTFIAAGHPQATDRNYPAPLIQQSLKYSPYANLEQVQSTLMSHQMQ